jgi:hypothetical protein
MSTCTRMWHDLSTLEAAERLEEQRPGGSENKGNRPLRQTREMPLYARKNCALAANAKFYGS